MIPTREELLAKVRSIASKGGVHVPEHHDVCLECGDTGRIVEENDDGKVSWRTCPCTWGTR